MEAGKIFRARQGQKQLFDAAAWQKLAAFASLLLLIIFFSFATPYFFNYDNLITVVKQTAITGIVALGVTMVIITAGIDLSLGSLVAVSGVCAAMLLNSGVPIVFAIMAGALAGVICGLCSGIAVAYLRLPPFIATLGIMISARGLSLVLSGGRPVYFLERLEFKQIYNYEVFGLLPLPVLYLAILAIITRFILVRMAAGRYIFSVGSNEEAARLSGCPVQHTKVFVYMYSGLMCGLAGVLMAARLNSGQPAIAVGLELDAIAAAVIGGASLAGGEGTIMGTIIGALIMSVLRNGLNLMQVNQFWQQIIIGIVVLLAVYLDNLRRKRSNN